MEKIPKDGIVIFAPNHCNTLIDALNILKMRKEPTVYGARADLFNNPIMAKILRFLKILPMVRVRDGLSNVTKNYETMAEIYTVLGDGVPFCMFPEGTHRPMHSLLPLKKGVFRIAFEADQLYDKNVYVVPVGLEYGDYFRYGSTFLLQIGDPVNVTEYLERHPDQGDAENYRQLLEILRQRMSQLITYIPDDERYAGVWGYTKVMTAGRKPYDLKERLENNRKVVSSALNVSDKDREAMDAKLAASAALDAKRKAAGISFHSFGYKNAGARFALKTLATVLCLPLFIQLSIMSVLQLGTSVFLCSKVIKDPAFRNSVRDAVNFLLGPLVGLIFFIIGLCTGMGALGALVLGFLAYLAPFLVFYAWEWLRIWVSDFKLLMRKDLQKEFESIRG